MYQFNPQEMKEKCVAWIREFFEKNGHKIIPSASLIPENDPSVLFNTAGMQPLIPYLKGEKHPLGTRLCDYQKCIRTNDLESIGDTTNDFAHIEYYEGSLRDIASHETAVAMANLHELDQRRKQLVQVSPYLAAYGELPPEPKTSPEMIEHVQIDLEREVSEKLEEIETRKLNLSDSNTESER